MSLRLDETLAALLEDVDTAPDGEPLEDALDKLTDFVQVWRGALLAALAPRPVPEPPQTVVRYSETHAPVLRAFIAMLNADEGMNYIPPAVNKRGTAHIPTPVPDGMTEAQFQLLLEAEAQVAEDRGEETAAKCLRQDLKRRQDAFAAQERRAEQLAKLGPPLAGRASPGQRAGV